MLSYLRCIAAIAVILLASTVGCGGEQWAFAPGAYPSSGHYRRADDSLASDGTSANQADLPYRGLAPDGSGGSAAVPNNTPAQNYTSAPNNAPPQSYAPAQNYTSAPNNAPPQSYAPAQGYAPQGYAPPPGNVMLASNTTAVGNGPPITQPPPSGPVARFDGTILAPNEPGPTLMAPQQAPVDPNAIQYAPTGPANPPPTADQPVFHRPSFEDRIHGFALRVWEDYRNYYTWGTACDVGIGLAVAASLAETPMDIHFRDWYQNDVRTSGTDSVAKVFKNFGEGTYMIPAAITLTVAGELLDEYPVAGTIGDFGERWTRAYIVGALPFLTLQYGLGAARPTWRDNASQWRPFQDSYGVSASGHAFISSVPFLTAAEMVDDPLLKGVFYFGSTLTAWSRVNDDAHFLSQVILGWCLGYVSVRAVNHTELEAKSNFSMTPVVSQDMTGVGFNFRW